MLWYTKLGGRKFIVTMLSLFATTAGLFTSHLQSHEFGLIICAILGEYGYFNVKKRLEERKAAYNKEKEVK